MATTRWQLRDTDTDETWTMPINPDSMSPVPLVSRSFRHAGTRRRGRRTPRTFSGPPPAKTLQWAGVIRTQDHYDQLVRWARKSVEVEVTDHIGRRFIVLPTAFRPEDRRPTPRTPWRLRYEMESILLEVVA